MQSPAPLPPVPPVPPLPPLPLAAPAAPLVFVPEATPDAAAPPPPSPSEEQAAKPATKLMTRPMDTQRIDPFDSGRRRASTARCDRRIGMMIMTTGYQSRVRTAMEKIVLQA